MGWVEAAKVGITMMRYAANLIRVAKTYISDEDFEAIKNSMDEDVEWLLRDAGVLPPEVDQ